MSASNAIELVTSALLKLLGDNIGSLVGNPDDDITAKPPDKARGTKTGPQINVFLYHTGVNAAMRNLGVAPPLPLDLFYMLTAYGSNDDDREAHRLIGRALQILNDNPLIAALADQPERVRLTFQPFTSEESYRLWSTFQTQYRISAAFQVSVVLIDNERVTASALPVLRRGSDDRGPSALASALPTLTSVDADVTPAAVSGRLGDRLKLRGQNLPGSNALVRFTSNRLPAPLDLTPTSGTSDTLFVQLPSDAAATTAWTPGFYTVQLVLTQPGLPPFSSNEVPFTLAPLVTRTPASVSPGDTLTVASNPHLQTGQRILVLFGSLPIAGPSIVGETPSVDVTVPSVAAGTYTIRLRVDGVDSLPMRLTGTPPRFEFDPNQQVTV